MYDYLISLPETPAFSDNIALMIEQIAADGESPTIKRTATGFTQAPSIGTQASAGLTLLHIRLATRYTEAELITYLQSVMIAPMPPLTVESARSAYKIIEIDSGDPEIPNTFDYEVIITPNKAKLLAFMPDIYIDENTSRRPTVDDALDLSTYAGTAPIML